MNKWFYSWYVIFLDAEFVCAISDFFYIPTQAHHIAGEVLMREKRTNIQKKASRTLQELILM